MPAGLDPPTAARLARICALFSSDVSGERSAAAWQAHKLLTAAGLDWHDVFAPAAPVRVEPAPPSSAAHIGAARWALQFHERLTDRERKFLADIGRCRRISAKQAAWLADILRQLRGGGG